MSNVEYFSQAGLEKIKQELHEMKTDGRRRIANAIAEAREKGDLKENAEYDAAKEEQGLHEARIAQLETTIANARVLDDTQLDDSKVHVLCSVWLKNKKTNKEIKYTLVSASEANLREGKLNVDSPVGKGLLGKEVGDVAKIKVPAGELEFEVLKIKTEI